MEADGLWKAAPRSRRAFPQPLENAGKTRRRFPHLPQPLLLAERIDQNRQTTDHTYPRHCYRCFRSNLLPMFQVAPPKADEGEPFCHHRST